MSAETELKKAVLNFVKNHHESGGKAPSIRAICREVDGVSVRKFYKLFPGGLGEVCKKAGVPVPSERIKATRKAVKSQERNAPIVENQRAGFSPKIVLSEMQISRLQGTSHLEGGKDPSLILDELLERDTYLRKTKELSLDDTKVVFDYLEAAKKREWKIPWLLGIQVKLWNAGIMGLDSKKIDDMVCFMEKMIELGWRAEEIPRFLKQIKDTEILNHPNETQRRLIHLCEEITSRGWQIDQFVQYTTDYCNEITLYNRFVRGEITKEQAINSLGLQKSLRDIRKTSSRMIVHD